MSAQGEMTSAAFIEGDYRYMLSRRWGNGATMKFIMLNPSTADASEDDPTIRRCIGFARREGLDGIHVVNLFALRSTDPDGLLHHPDPRGTRNAEFIVQALSMPGPNVCAWGGWFDNHKNRPKRINMVEMARRSGVGLHCLGFTKAGAPRHPLYLKRDTPLAPYPYPFSEQALTLDGAA
jgi:hypothetical protein